MKSIDGMPTGPSEVIMLTGDDFTFAMQVGNAGGAYKMPMESPARFGVNVEVDQGVVERLQFTDHPLNRFGLAVREHFQNDRTKTASFFLRWWASQKLLEEPECQRYVKPEPESNAILVHSSVFEAAATQPMNQSWEFERTTFFKRVAELYAIDPT